MATITCGITCDKTAERINGILAYNYIDIINELDAIICICSNLAPFLMYFLLYWKRHFTRVSRTPYSASILGFASGVSFKTTASTWKGLGTIYICYNISTIHA